MSAAAREHRLLRPIDPRRDHIRGGEAAGRLLTILIYGDYLCPYCRRLRYVLERLRSALGERMVYVFRHFPNERAHPGAELTSIGSEAAGRQGRFWEMHDALYSREPSIDEGILREIAASLGLDTERFQSDLHDCALRRRIEEDLADGRRNGVTATPTIFIDGVRYDGAWDFYSMLEALEQPVGTRVRRTARAFANLPTSAGLVLLAAGAAAVLCANSPLAPFYRRLVGAQLGFGASTALLSLSIGNWCAEGLLAIFFLILGLEIRRELTGGSLADWRAAAAPVLAALGAIAGPALFYRALNPGATAAGWSIPADTGIAFTLAVLALFGTRASAGLKVFVATYAVADDIFSIVILALFYPHTFTPTWLLPGAGAIVAMAIFNRWRIYAIWPYLTATIGLWLSLHLAGVSGALSGIALAAFLPLRPAPKAGPLLAQAATALAELEHAEHELKRAGNSGRVQQEPVWDWASRNLSAAAERLLSPAERVESAAEPWSTYLVLPLFAFTAAGVSLHADFSTPHALAVFAGTALGLALAKPVGWTLATWIAAKAGIAAPPADTSVLAFIGAGFLCGIGDPLSLLMADQAFQSGAYAAIAKIGVLAGSVLAAILGASALSFSPEPNTVTFSTQKASGTQPERV
ncbi:MAG TPA: Na+/H+ antiporter NhaA [Steroidobacteraceae bacterium]|nr:Na+/H+ antiporter NhaA [Steroidobacteraceae bacterium]